MENKAPQMLQDWLTEQDRTASWLARQLAVSPSTVMRWLPGGGSIPKLETRQRMADITGLPIDAEGAWL